MIAWADFYLGGAFATGLWAIHVVPTLQKERPLWIAMLAVPILAIGWPLALLYAGRAVRARAKSS